MPISLRSTLSVLDLKNNFEEGQNCDKTLLLCCFLLVVHIDLYLVLQIEGAKPNHILFFNPSAEDPRIRKDDKCCSMDATISPLCKAEKLIHVVSDPHSMRTVILHITLVSKVAIVDGFEHTDVYNKIVTLLIKNERRPLKEIAFTNHYKIQTCSMQFSTHSMIFYWNTWFCSTWHPGFALALTNSHQF